MAPSWELRDSCTGSRLLCSVFLRPSWEFPCVLMNPRILGQGGRLVCSVFPGDPGNYPGFLGIVVVVGRWWCVGSSVDYPGWVES